MCAGGSPAATTGRVRTYANCSLPFTGCPAVGPRMWSSRSQLVDHRFALPARHCSLLRRPRSMPTDSDRCSGSHPSPSSAAASTAASAWAWPTAAPHRSSRGMPGSRWREPDHSAGPGTPAPFRLSVPSVGASVLLERRPVELRVSEPAWPSVLQRIRRPTHCSVARGSACASFPDDQSPSVCRQALLVVVPQSRQP